MNDTVTQFCILPYQCEYLSIEIAIEYSTINAYSYKSYSNVNISNSIVESVINCYGSYSCINIEIPTSSTGNELNCHASFACQNVLSKFHFSGSSPSLLTCTGIGSCTNMTVNTFAYTFYGHKLAMYWYVACTCIISISLHKNLSF